jgi:hypothetical protein
MQFGHLSSKLNIEAAVIREQTSIALRLIEVTSAELGSSLLLSRSRVLADPEDV